MSLLPSIVNSSIEDEATCQFVEMRISYESDLDHTMEIMREEAEAHPSCIDRRTPEELEEGVPRVVVRVIKLEESHMLLRAYVWAEEPITARVMQFDLFRSMKLRFDREGIVIPYPQRTISFKGDQQAALQGSIDLRTAEPLRPNEEGK